MSKQLPPLPVKHYVDQDGLWSEAFGPYSADQMRAYAEEAMQMSENEKLPTSSVSDATLTANLSKTPAEAYERGFMDGYKRAIERCAEICDNIDAMSLDPMVCRGSAEECAAAIRDSISEVARYAQG